ncbi:MAG TPA: CBS domain-containing protein [Gemmatimonadales bacterium]
MLRVRDIMSTDVVTVSPELSLRDAFELLAQRHLGGVPVATDDRVLGVLSATDLLEFTATVPPVPTERPEVPEIEEWATPEDWQEGSEPPGAFFHELWADVGTDALERFRKTGSPEWDILEEHTVAEAMTRAPLCAVGPEAPVSHAAARMMEARVHRLLVMKEGKLAGIVTMSDVAGAVADGRLISAAPSHGPHVARS